MLFGAIDPTPHGPVDGLVVVLRGPGKASLCAKTKSFGIWVNQQAYRMGPLPGLATVSSAPLSDLAPAEERRQLNIGAAQLDAALLSGTASAREKQEALQAFVRLKTADALFDENAQAVEIIDDRLFRAEIKLPAGMPVGRYVTEFFAFKNGRVVGYRTGELPVDIVGAGHILGEAAHNHRCFMACQVSLWRYLWAA